MRLRNASCRTRPRCLRKAYANFPLFRRGGVYCPAAALQPHAFRRERPAAVRCCRVRRLVTLPLQPRLAPFCAPFIFLHQQPVPNQYRITVDKLFRGASVGDVRALAARVPSPPSPARVHKSATACAKHSELPYRRTASHRLHANDRQQPAARRSMRGLHQALFVTSPLNS